MMTETALSARNTCATVPTAPCVTPNGQPVGGTAASARPDHDASRHLAAQAAHVLTRRAALRGLGSIASGLATITLGGGSLLLAGCATRQPAPLPRNAANDVTREALAQVGKPYRWGGASPRQGFDCSGLVQHVYREALGIELPRTSREMGTRGMKVGRANLAPGDLVFFQTGRHPNSHVGIYIGRGRFVHAPSSGSVVRVEAIDKRYWMKRFNGGRRPVKI